MTGKNKNKDKADPQRAIAQYKKARHLYHFDDVLEVGLVLKGSEVKALREGKGSFVDAYAKVKNGEVWLTGFHISPYSNSGYTAHDPDRPKKLLMSRRQIDKWATKAQLGGYTLAPLKAYWKDQRVKIELGLGKGKKLYDKREDAKAADAKREMDRALKR